MYGPSSGQLLFMALVIALIGGALVLGVEHCGGYVARHLEMKWK